MITVDAPRTSDTLDADPLCLEAARRAGDAQYDAAWNLLFVPTKPNPIHTRIVTGSAHSPRDSLGYALTLLELAAAGDAEVDGEPRTARAARVLGAVLDLQDTDPLSDTYGIWPYWAEELLTEMTPPDWNWADFLGELLALILLRHEARLAPDLQRRARSALLHAARAIIRRDVDLEYTNIAVKGAFVTLAAGELLGEDDIRAYGAARMRKLHASLEQTRSFAEYNSPTYWNVVIQAFTAVRQYIGDPDLAGLARDAERTAWEHFLARWHPATGQLTGPMARCYNTDLRRSPGTLLVVQRVAGDTWTWFDDESIPAAIHLAHDAVLDYRIPDDLRPLLDRPAPPPLSRERFSDTHYIPGQVAGVSATAAAGIPAVVVPTVGTSWRQGSITLGSVNLSDTWVQRRPILGFWQEPGDDPTDTGTRARSVEVEVVRDGHGFAGGSFSAVQEGGDILWAVSLATPSGDAHIHLDTIEAGVAIATRELAVRFRVSGLAPDAVRVDGIAPGTPATFEHARRVEMRTAGVWIQWSLAGARFDSEERAARVRVRDDEVEIEVPWLDAAEPRELVIEDLGATYAGGSLRMGAEPEEDRAVTASVSDDMLALTAGDLCLVAPARPGSRLDHARVAARNNAR